MAGWSHMARGAAVALFLCSALSLSSARAENAVPDPRATETLPHDEALQALGGSLGASVKATQSDPRIPDILKALDRNIAAAKHIREMVGGKDKVTDAEIADVARQVSAIAKSFRQIAELAPGVSSGASNSSPTSARSARRSASVWPKPATVSPSFTATTTRSRRRSGPATCRAPTSRSSA